MYCQEYDSALDNDFDPGNPGWGRAVRCPLYADYGCFAGNYTTADGSTGFYRGCSTFSDPTGELMGWGPGPVCNNWNDGDNSCKQKCDTHYCNRDKLRNPTQCYVCQESYDHTGTKLNRPGDVDNCVSIIGDEHLVNCDLIYDHCVSETITDWNIDGSQQYRLIRACKAAHNGEDTSCFQGERIDFLPPRIRSIGRGLSKVRFYMGQHIRLKKLFCLEASWSVTFGSARLKLTR